MKRLVHTTALSTLILGGCIATVPATRPTVQESLMQEGKLLYELGRFDESRNRLEDLLNQTTEERLRVNATYYLNRIKNGLAPDPIDPRIPSCFEP